MGVNASVHTAWEYRPGVTGVMDVGIQVIQGYWGYGRECFSAHSLGVQARGYWGYWGYGRGNTGNTGVTGVMGMNASLHTACIPCIHP